VPIRIPVNNFLLVCYTAILTICRIELEAVERIISSLGDGIECVSVQVNTAGTGLCAFIAPQHVDGNLVRAGVAKQLPEYMVPSAIYTLPRLPLNTNDKVDHKAIKAQMETLIAQYGKGNGALARSAPPAVARISTPPLSSDVRSKTNTEGVIGQIWQDVLGLSSRPASETNFFELGGNRCTIH
jgi:AMP-binding enzyme C-terminal domain